MASLLAVDHVAASSQYGNAGALNIDTNSLTIAIWLSWKSLGESDSTERIFFGNIAAGDAGRLYFRRRWQEQRLRLNWDNGTPGHINQIIESAVWTPTLNTWYLVVVTLAAGNGAFYVNNVAKGTDSNENYNAKTVGDVFLAGLNNAGTPGVFFDGPIAALGLWTSVLGASALTALYALGPTKMVPVLWQNVEAGTLAHLWLYDTGQGTDQIIDVKRGADATLVAGPTRVYAPVIRPARGAYHAGAAA